MNEEIATAPAPVRQFSVLLSATRRGVRLARLLSVQQLIDWEVPFGAAAHVVAELAANAATHGHVRGRGFRLTLALHGSGSLRVAVADPRPEVLPCLRRPDTGDTASGRGLILVEAFTDRWGVDQGPAPCKTVWAELDLA